MSDGLNGYRFKIKFDPLAGAAGSYRVNNVENILVRERVALTCNRVLSFNGYREHFISKHQARLRITFIMTLRRYLCVGKISI